LEPVTDRARSPHGERHFLPEVQALRALAVAVVIAFHLWPERVPGGFVGVDVFFVISGFLITGHLMREATETGRIRLRAFWARRIRRLLPAAVLVLGVTLVAVLLVMPAVAWQRIVAEIAAAAAYVLNWLLAANSVDYFAAGSAATPVQHYWSLSVEEQFYLIWPLLLIGMLAAATRSAVSRARVVAAGIGVVFAASLAVSVVWAFVSPASGYFATFTHAWEFALGAGVSLAGPLLSRGWFAERPRLRATIGWLGLATIALSSLLFTGALPFPGAVALMPTLGAALVIAAGTDRRSRLSPAILTDRRPVQWLGDVSYSAYLWHWPPIVLVPVALGRPLDLPVKLVILGATLVLAGLTKRYVEDPFRRSPVLSARPRHAFVFAAGAAAVLVVGSAVPWTVVQRQIDEADERVDAVVTSVLDRSAECFGAAAALEPGCFDDHRADPEFLFEPALGEREPEPTGGGLSAELFGDPTGAVTIGVVGDSHAAHYLPALDALGRRHGWRLLMFKVNSCSPSAPTWTSTWSADGSEACQTWRQALLDDLPELASIDLVVTSSVAPRYARTETFAVQEQAAAAFTTMWDSWLDADIPVVVIADVPGPGEEVGEASECVAAHLDETDPCTAPRSVVVEPDAMVIAATASPRPGLTLLDFTDVYCSSERCHAVVGGVGVYRGGAHLSHFFSLSLAPYLEPAIDDALRSGVPG
jgi:peptidoglycan/LPS O-acetylase OafA/YrhL